MAGLASALALLLAATSVATVQAESGTPEASEGEAEVIAGKNDGHDRMTVPVHIGEHGPFRFIIDTGSQRSVLSTDLASQLALSPIEKRRIIGIAGSDIAETTVLDELALGRRSFTGLLVLLFESEHIGADGIVGIDSLQRQRVLIDFDRNRMTVGDAKSQGGNSGFEIVVTARRRSGQLIMTDAEIDGIKTSVVIDTGSNTSVGNRALQRALGQRNNLTQAVLVSVTGQEVVADIGFARKLAIGDVAITNPIIAFTDGPAFEALDLDRRPAMMLGMRELRLFKRVAIDFSARKVFFDLPKGI
jgi:predicted aspartyl protease